MSAFFDIWFSKVAKPVYKRSVNKEWKSISDHIWMSEPWEMQCSFVTQLENDGYNMILLGQLYEKITAHEVLSRCVAHIQKQQPFEDPAGHYIIFIIEKKNNALHVFTNRFGTYHAYWMQESGNNCISTSFIALAKQKKQKQLNWEGITGFMAMGYFSNDTTYLEDISIFEPASYYRFDAEMSLVQKERYWQWYYEPSLVDRKEQLQQLQEALHHCLDVSTENYKTAIPISGGLDSRLLAGELTNDTQHNYKQITAFSYGYTKQSHETKIAEAIAAKRNITLHKYVLPDYLFERLDDITEAVELFQYIDGTRQASATRWLQHNADIVVGGHWGDVWMNDMSVADGQLQPAFEKKVIKKGADWLLNNICNRHLSNSKDYLNDYFSSFIHGISYIASDDMKMKIYKTDQWSFRWTTASVRMYQWAAMPVLPFYDRRVAELFLQIPVKDVKDRRLEIAYIKQYYSDLAKVKWQEYDANLYNYPYFNNRNVAYRAVKKIQRGVSKQPAIQRNWEVFYLNPRGKKHLQDKLLHNTKLHDMVSAEKIQQLIEAFYRNPTAANGYTISMLLTFAVFLEKVFD